MKTALIHMGYFIALIILSLASFFVILGAGFVGKINIVVLLIPLVLSVLWLSDYTWRFLSTNPNRIQLIRPKNNWEFISLFLSGIIAVYSLFLSTLVPVPIEPAPPWIFLGTPILLLLYWYWLLYRYIKNPSNYLQRVLSLILFISSLVYTIQIWSFTLSHT